MKENDREDEFLGKVLSTLDKSARELDPETTARLRHIRAEAVERGGSRVWAGFAQLFRFPVAGFATAAVILLAAFLYVLNPFGNSAQNGVDASEILVTNENLEFYEQLDFYRWLTEEAGRSGKEETYFMEIGPRYASYPFRTEMNRTPEGDGKSGTTGPVFTSLG